MYNTMNSRFTVISIGSIKLNNKLTTGKFLGGTKCFNLKKEIKFSIYQ